MGESGEGFRLSAEQAMIFKYGVRRQPDSKTSQPGGHAQGILGESDNFGVL